VPKAVIIVEVSENTHILLDVFAQKKM
jgi:hypothetical protein